VVVLDPVRQFPAGTGCEFDVTAHRAAANVYRGLSSGVSIYQFLPGDVGPDGQIVDHWFAWEQREPLPPNGRRGRYGEARCYLNV
jgi:hypothetical protein